MFTGIVQGIATVIKVDIKEQLHTLVIDFPAVNSHGFTIGASIAINGTCLTVTDFKDTEVHFDVIEETLACTNLGQLIAGSLVNFERSAKMGDEIGGHVMSGHIVQCVEITDIRKTDTNCSIYFNLPETIKPYILAKGFVGLNGCSLTIGEVTESSFNVHLIPETLAVTLFGCCKVGDHINLELDAQTQAIVDTVERVLAARHNQITK